MPTIDPRLLDLIETLIGVHLDWLAAEILEGVLAGVEDIETETALEEARQSIRARVQPSPRFEPGRIAEPRRVFGANEQIEWAAAYVAERLEGAITDLDTALNHLNEIGRSGLADPPRSPAPSTIVILADDADLRKADPEGTTNARARLNSLREV